MLAMFDDMNVTETSAGFTVQKRNIQDVYTNLTDIKYESNCQNEMLDKRNANGFKTLPK
jgi:hypothetical protein